jgi:hypothetical protein
MVELCIESWIVVVERQVNGSIVRASNLAELAC